MILPIHVCLRGVAFVAASFGCLISVPASVLRGAVATEGWSLVDAVRKGDAARWRELLASRPDVNQTDAGGSTALHVAALNHDVAAVTALLAAGADADRRNEHGATPLIYGAGNPEIVAVLLKGGANPNAASKIKVTPLLAAVAHPVSFASARLLLEAGADLRVKRTGDVEAVLARAVSGGDRRTLELLIERGAARDARGAASALAAAAFAGELDVVELLLRHGADPNLDPAFGGHALNTALLADQQEIARRLIAHGADLNLRSPAGHGTPPIVFAAYSQSGDPAIAQQLLARGVDVNAANDHGATALGYALRSGAGTPLADYLRKAGAKSSEAPRLKRTPDRPVPAAFGERTALVRERLPATLGLLQRSSDAFLDNRFVQTANCTSCHGQDLPAVAYGLARERGFAIDEVSWGRQLALQVKRWTERAEYARQMTPPLPGAPATIAYGLFGLRAARYPADEMTDAMARYLIRTQRAGGEWIDPIRRPPIEDGTFFGTTWVALSVRDYAPSTMQRAAGEALARSASWIAQQSPARNNETVFQLLGLHWSNAPIERRRTLAEKLAAAQRADGGWSQLPGLESDAWATGSALYALHEAAGMSARDPVYQRGVAFLLRTQFEDGSWWVRSRSWPFQPHFNGQFPHGKDQWISQGATAWAAMALLFTLEPVKQSKPAPNAQALMAIFAQSPAAQRRKPERSAPANETTAAVDFARDIKPLFERSCAGCHGGEKPRGGFALVSRDALLKGGASGEPAIAPGYADDSTLIQYVTGKIEDLEMPPLDRREKYPALSAVEIDRLRAWIDAGAPWPATGAASAKSALEE